MVTMDAFGYMIQGDLRLERQGNALILKSKHNARWLGVLVGGFALFVLFKLFNVPAQSGFGLLVYCFSVAIGVAILGIGVFLSLPREVTTTFDPDSRRVVHHVSIGQGRYERRRTNAFAEVLGLRLNGYAAEPDSYMPVMKLYGETRWLSTANASFLICETTIEAICAETGLQKLGVGRQRLWGS
jgi:hypothetical protein